jgi:hypothetical protein
MSALVVTPVMIDAYNLKPTLTTQTVSQISQTLQTMKPRDFSRYEEVHLFHQNIYPLLNACLKFFSSV